MNPDFLPPPAPPTLVKSSSRTGKPLRVMLPRGASCTVCRRRKVKCDGIKPACSQCIKSSASSASQVHCLYEGPPAANAAAALSYSGGSSPMSEPSVKKPRVNSKKVVEVPGGGHDEMDELEPLEDHYTTHEQRYGRYQEHGQDNGNYDAIGRGEGSELKRENKRKLSLASTLSDVNSRVKVNPGVSHQRVDVLVSRISELERRLADQSDDQPRHSFAGPSSHLQHSHQSNASSSTLPPLLQPYLHQSQQPTLSSGSPYSHHYQSNLPPHLTNLQNASSSSSSPILSYPAYPHSTSFQHPQQQQQRQHSRPGSASDYYSPPIQNIAIKINSTSNHYALPMSSNYSHHQTHYSQHTVSGNSESNGKIKEEEASGMEEYVGAGLERRTSRNGFDESDTRTSTPVLPSRLVSSSNPAQLKRSAYDSFIPLNTHAPSTVNSPSYPFLSPQNYILPLSSPQSESSPGMVLPPPPTFSSNGSSPFATYSESQRQLIAFPAPANSSAMKRGRLPYPLTLPPYPILVHLVHLFFTRASVPSSIFDRPRFLRAIERGRGWATGETDASADDELMAAEAAAEEWPEEALLHAICGFAVVFVAQGALGTPYWIDFGEEIDGLKRREGGESTGEGKHNSKARAFHFEMAKRGIDRAVYEMGQAGGGGRRGRGLFQILQAIIISSYIAYASASFTSLWLLCGTATRLCTPLQLNHLPAWDYVNNRVEQSGVDWKKIGRSGGFYPSSSSSPSYDDERRNTMNTGVDPGGVAGVLWGPPQTREEHYERTITFWTAFSIDRHASASTDWSTSIDELDITTLIPCQGPAPRAALSINHPEFLNEFAKPVNSVGRYVKAVVLLGRVVNYIQRLPRFEDLQKEDVGGEGRTASEFMRAVKATPAFLQLDAALGRFRTATSGMLFDKGDHVDGHLASAYVVPHAASILLHEIFTDPFDRSSTSSIARCLTSAKCIVNSTYLLYESSNDLSGCDPFLPFSWSVVARSLVRDHAIKTSWGEHNAASISRGLAEHCLGFTERCGKLRGTPIAVLLTANLRAMLDSTTPSKDTAMSFD